MLPCLEMSPQTRLLAQRFPVKRVSKKARFESNVVRTVFGVDDSLQDERVINLMKMVILSSPKILVICFCYTYIHQT